MKKSHKVLEAFLVKHYMKSEGADNLDVAIRDCLTDLFHIAMETGTDLHQRLRDAESVWVIEAKDEAKFKNKVWLPRWNPKKKA